MNRHRVIAWSLTLVSIIYAIIAGNVEGIPSWTIAIPFVITGFWWAFGHEVFPDDTRSVGRERDRKRYRDG